MATPYLAKNHELEAYCKCVLSFMLYRTLYRSCHWALCTSMPIVYTQKTQPPHITNLWLSTMTTSTVSEDIIFILYCLSYSQFFQAIYMDLKFRCYTTYTFQSK